MQKRGFVVNVGKSWDIFNTTAQCLFRGTCSLMFIGVLLPPFTDITHLFSRGGDLSFTTLRWIQKKDALSKRHLNQNGGQKGIRTLGTL